MGMGRGDEWEWEGAPLRNHAERRAGIDAAGCLGPLARRMASWHPIAVEGAAKPAE